MILAFANDQTVTVLNTVAQANTYCEGIDVEAGIFTFTDEHGELLLPVFTTPNSKWSLGPLRFVDSGVFKLEATGERHVELLQDVLAGHISVSEGPTTIRTSERLKEILQHGGL